MSITSKPSNWIRKPIDKLDEDKLVFYDIETDHQFAPYTKIKMISAQYGWGKPFVVRTEGEMREFKRKVAAPDVIKVDFNGVNFDRTVCRRHKIPIHPLNAHDLFFMFKTMNPNLPAFAMKFIAFYFLGDPHFPQMELNQWCLENGKSMSEAPFAILASYNKHDIVQTEQLFRVCWDHVITDEHWKPYMNDLLMGEPLYEMEIEGGIYLDPKRIWVGLHRLQKRIQRLTARAIKLTHGAVQNPNSSAQLASWFSRDENIEMKLTDNGEFQVNKQLLVAIKETNKVGWIAFKIREALGVLKYYENYLKALEDTTYKATQRDAWIPVQFSVSSARTRRFTSQSYYKLNFQNPNKEAKKMQVVPDGFVGFSHDATQIENVVHIYESKDTDRRRAYERDTKWNEYVWLCQRITNTDKTKEELDEIPSQQVPNWSVYKQYKTGKLGLNFGMGVGLYCEMFGLTRVVGEETFADIHRACPAIRELQDRVAYDLKRYGFVKDAFGKRYSGPPRLAYKVVAYMVQGCGTGSLPKAQIRANWETLRSFDKLMPSRLRGTKCGVMCLTTHDENTGRISLELGPERILQCLQKMNFNMTKKFSPLFDNIPLRSKMYLTRTTQAAAEEVDINDTKKILTYLTK